MIVRYPPRKTGAHTGWSPNRDRAEQARLRRRALGRDRYRCVDCGHHDPSGKALRCCHLEPLSEGGSHTLDNVVIRCCDCDRRSDPYAR
jgi:5-methylcytosine-specific restriction endonuclease McrA